MTGLTELEFHALDLTAQLARAMAEITGNGSTRADDLREADSHVHAIQHMIMAQAAARAYPDRFRLLGAS